MLVNGGSLTIINATSTQVSYQFYSLRIKWCIKIILCIFQTTKMSIISREPYNYNNLFSLVAIM